MQKYQPCFDRKITCAFTGHRNLPENFNVDLLKKSIENAISNGYTYFLVGMAVGFDSLCFKVLRELKKKNENIIIVACIPCKNQSKNFSFKQKAEYTKMVEQSDIRIMLGEEYTPYCMMNRNMYMVDNCSLLIAYLRENYGGTKNTVNYATKKGDVKVEII